MTYKLKYRISITIAYLLLNSILPTNLWSNDICDKIDQKDFDPIFCYHIQELIQRSAFFGLRNYGSIKALSNYLDPDLASKLVFQPSPTTLLRYLYPDYYDRSAKQNHKKLALNVAFDWYKRRFGDKEDKILSSIPLAMRCANRQGCENYLPVHMRVTHM